MDPKSQTLEENAETRRLGEILVFISFIEASKRALEQAIALGKIHESHITVCHVSERGIDKDRNELEPYLEKVREAGLEVELIIEEGVFFDLASVIAERVNPDLVIVGTRGIEGFDMRFFGSAIYKLVKELSQTTLVLHTQTPLAPEGYRNVMLPVSPHAQFLKKVKETAKILAKDGVIHIFAIVQEGTELDNKIKSNIEESLAYLKDQGLVAKYLEVRTNKPMQGFARATLEKIKEDGMDLVSIMANVSDQNRHFGKMDKEDILLNEINIPILCVNTGEASKAESEFRENPFDLF